MYVKKVDDSNERVYLGKYCDNCQNEKEAVLNQSLQILQNQKFLDKHTQILILCHYSIPSCLNKLFIPCKTKNNTNRIENNQ